MAIMRLGKICAVTNMALLLLISTNCNYLGSHLVSAQSASNAKARYHYYNPEENNWSLDDAQAYFATWDDSKQLTWRKAYGWTTFCGASGPTGQSACGKCLKVTNVKNGASATVRIVDQCSNGDLTLDTSVFRQLDSNHNGFYNGYLTVDYQFVSC